MTTLETPVPTWDLASLYPHPETAEFRKGLAKLETDLRSLAERSESLPAVACDPTTVAAWAELLAAYQETEARHSDLLSFITCHGAADAENKEIQQQEARLVAADPLRQRVISNFEFACAGAADDVFESFLTADPRLGEIAFFLRECRRNARLRLPKEQELLDAELAVNGIHAWGLLYDRVCGEVRVEVMERGEIVRKSPGQVHLDSPERAVRENNFFAADRAWQRLGDTCADALNHIAGWRLTRYRRLGLADHLEAPLRRNRMQRATLEAMWGAIASRSHVLLPYLEAKAKLLGLDKLAWWDLSAPVPAAGTSSRMSYAEACNTVVRTFTAFSPELGSFAESAIAKRWIEAEDRPGKRQGGFCTDFPVPKQTRIFMTFTGSSDGMSTLAHELGHAYHTWVLRDQPLVLRDYPANLAETASTFAEAVLGDERLRGATSAGEELAILDVMLMDAVAMFMNIRARFLFEDRFHRERASGTVAPSRLSELMLEAQREAYVDALAADGWNPRFWISKLHFYFSTLPFYNFPYTFGYLLSLGIKTIGEQSPEGFADRFRAFLLATGSKVSEDAVRSTFGDDLTTGEFWNRGIDVVERRVARFVELAK